MADERLWNSNYCKVMVANFALYFLATKSFFLNRNLNDSVR